MAWVLDLDGVIWLAHVPIEGAAEAVAMLDAAGEEVLFVTNFSALRLADAEQKLADCGIDAAGRVITSAMAAASLVEPGERVMVCGGEGVWEAIEARGAVALDPGDGIGHHKDVDAVVVGFHRNFDFGRLAAAVRAIHEGARLISTNADPTYPTPTGLLPGNGALVAAVATAGKVDAVIAGKPHPPVARLVHERLGSTQGDRSHIVVGDLPATDGMLAHELGFRFGLVLSGVTPPSAVPSIDPAPDVVADDLLTLVTDLLR
ncbi:MAG: HAD superfamily hydrolase (TIGR01450 family) [Candidatus Poriferisodalaceae bacterium]|jgi:HAD superfamily hydrolase (TIGR01450 family)